MESMSMHAYAWLFLQVAAVAMPPAATPFTSDAAGSSIPTSSVVNSPFNVSSQFSPTMVIILVILLSAFFFMGFFAIYVRRCTSEDSFLQSGGNTLAGRRHDATAGRGLGIDPSLVESFPMVSYAAAKKRGCNECVVCLADFERGEEMKQLPKCKHVFHPGCIGMWLESHTTCPLCRRSLVNSDRWSMSWRWGGSSRGTNEGDSSHSRRDGEQGTASPILVPAGSSTGWQMVIAGRNGDENFQVGAQEEGDLVPGGLPGLTSSAPPAYNLASSSIEIVSGDLQAGCTFCGRSEVAVPRGSGWARKNGASRFSSERGVTSMMQAAASQGRRRLGRCNTTGHSLRKDVMTRAAGPMTAGCMTLTEFMSRSIGGLEEEETMVGPDYATSHQSPHRAGCCTRSATSLLSEK